MRLPTLTVLGLGSLALAHAHVDAQKQPEKALDLGYLRCVSAVVKSTPFPSCTTSYKLDCFCELQGKNPSSQVVSHKVEDVCAENGVPRDEIARYLCDDGAVPVSPRRGSTPMGRVGKMQGITPMFDPRKEMLDHNENEQRGLLPDTPRLLIPENEDETGESDSTTESIDTQDQDQDQNQDDDQDQTEKKKEEEEKYNIEAETAIYEIVTVTMTETSCPCSSTAASTTAPNLRIHNTEAGDVSSPTSAAPGSTSESTGSASGSVRVESSSVGTEDEAVPTGVDAERHGADEDKGKSGDGQMFTGAAAWGMAVSRDVVMLASILAGVVLI
ncbi:hypothetical protein BJX99DRAFT_252599 [Aspergillus californicus]